MFGWLQDDAFLFEDQNLTKNGHSFGVDPSKFKTDNGLANIFEVTSVSYTADGRAFVATIEGKKYPFYGVQFHPEVTS